MLLFPNFKTTLLHSTKTNYTAVTRKFQVKSPFKQEQMCSRRMRRVTDCTKRVKACLGIPLRHCGFIIRLGDRKVTSLVPALTPMRRGVTTSDLLGAESPTLN